MNKIQADAFVNELVISLKGKDHVEAEGIAKKAIEVLQGATVELKPFDLSQIHEANLLNGTKWELCRAITEVFFRLLLRGEPGDKWPLRRRETAGNM